MTPAKYMFAYEEIKNLQVDLISFAGSGATSAPHFGQPWIAMFRVIFIVDSF